MFLAQLFLGFVCSSVFLFFRFWTQTMAMVNYSVGPKPENKLNKSKQNLRRSVPETWKTCEIHLGDQMECNWEQKDSLSQGWDEGWWIPWGNPKQTKKSKLHLKKHGKTIGETQKKQKNQRFAKPWPGCTRHMLCTMTRVCKIFVFFVFFEFLQWFCYAFWDVALSSSSLFFVSLGFFMVCIPWHQHTDLPHLQYIEVVLTWLLIPPMQLALWM